MEASKIKNQVSDQPTTGIPNARKRAAAVARVPPTPPREAVGFRVIGPHVGRDEAQGLEQMKVLKSGNLQKRSWVKISQIRTLSTTRLGDRVGRVAPEELAILIEGLNEIVAD